MDSSDAAGEYHERIRNPLSIIDDEGAVHVKLLAEYWALGKEFERQDSSPPHKEPTP